MVNEPELEYAGEKKRYREIIELLVITALFFLVNAVYSYIYSVSSLLRNDTALQIVIRISTWTVPVFIYLIIKKVNPFYYLKFCSNIPKGLLWGLSISGLIVLYNVVGTYILKGRVDFNLNIGMGLWWKAVILVGFSEEIMFRGFLLQKMAELTRFRIANLLNAGLFLLVHVPGWIFLGQFGTPAILNSVLYVALFGLLQGFVLKKTGSLWPCIMNHSVSNFLSLALV